MGFVHLAAENGSQAATRASSAYAMFVAVALLLGLFLLGVVLIMSARRIRQRRIRLSASGKRQSIDPWTESARRLQPYRRHENEE